jgi:hypothetical protein
MSASARLINTLVVFLVVILPLMVAATAKMAYQVTTAYVFLLRGEVGLAVSVYAVTWTISVLAVTISLVFPTLLYMRVFWDRIGDICRSFRELRDYRKRKRQGLLGQHT